MTPNPPALESLLVHREWVRALARTLVRDDASVDDVEQETWLAAMRAPHVAPRVPRAWLSGVVRRQAARLWRGEGRRARREQAGARTEALPATADVVERTEVHRRVVEAVLALDEPYRTAVLLRYFEGLPPRDVAARTGAPVETARSRIQRGVERLREHLDRRHGGGRPAWIAALAPLVSGGTSGSVPGGHAHGGSAGALAAGGLAGGVVMSSTAKGVLGGAAVLVLAGLAWWGLRPGGDQDTGDRRGEATREAAVAEPGHLGLAARGEGTAPAPEAPSVVAAPRELPTGSVLVRVLAGEASDAAGVVGARVVAAPTEGEPTEAVTDASGLAVLPPRAAGPRALWVSADGYAVARTMATLSVAETRVPLLPGARLRLRFLGGDGSGELASDEVRRRYERVGVEPRAEVIWNGALAAPDMASVFRTMFGSPAAWRRPSRVDWVGGARLAEPLGDGAWRVFVWTPDGTGFLSEAIETPDGKDAVLTVVVPETEGSMRSVRIVNALTRSPVPGALVRSYTEYGDDQAFFAGPTLVADDRGQLSLPSRGGGQTSWWVESPGLAGEIPDVVLRAHPSADVVDVEILPTATVEGEAYTAGGEPAVDRLVTFMRQGWTIGSRVDATGRFRLAGIPVRVRTYAGQPEESVGLGLVEDLDAAKITMVRVPVRPGETTRTVIGQAKAPGTTVTLRGRITAGGHPLPGVLLVGRDVTSTSGGHVARTDGAGAYLLEGLAPGRIEVRAYFCDPRVSDDYYLRLVDVPDLRGGDERTMDLDLFGGAVRVRVVDDATGERIPGAMARATPADGRIDTTRLSGWEYHVGNAAFVGEDGAAILLALPEGRTVNVIGYAQGYRQQPEPGIAVVPGTPDAPAEVEVRLAR